MAMQQQRGKCGWVQWVVCALGLGSWGWPALAWALQVQSVTPQGVVQAAQQWVVRTDADAVRLGNSQAPAPAKVVCTGHAQAAQGQGRWNNAREWVWQFQQPVSAGTRCSLQPVKTFRSATGQDLVWTASYSFEVAGPQVVATWPRSYEPVDEEQVFVLQLNGPATEDSLRQHVACTAPDVGQRIPVQLLQGAPRTAILEALGLRARSQAQPAQWAVLRCQRRLSAGTQVQLLYGVGVATPSGVTNRTAQSWDFTVRSPFTAEVACERERANAGCLPIRDVRLRLSAPISASAAQAIRLVPEGNVGKAIAAQWDEQDGDGLQAVRFAGPFVPLATYRLELPNALQDDAGRPLANAAAFPQSVRMGDTPPLVKFAAAPFGVIERWAEGPEGTAVLPVTVRHVEGPAGASSTTSNPSSQVRRLHVTQDAELIHWWDLVQRYDRGSIDRATARKELSAPVPAPLDDDDQHSVATRTLSLLQGQAGAQALALPLPAAPGGASQALEMVGIALPQPGLHVVEVASPRLGAALLDERLGTPRTMYVRTAVLVTNLSVHFKLGREGAAVWVTSLDQGQPVAGARVQVSDCRGQAHAQGTTDAQGLVRLPTLPREAPRCDDHAGGSTWFASARHTVDGVEDVAFVWSDWQRGIEPWRFNLPTGWGSAESLVAHTVMDRTLVRAGETVSMKHFVRRQTLQGLAWPQAWPTQVVITHVGSQQRYTQDLQWVPAAHGGRSTQGQFAVPPAAKLGVYTVQLRWPGQAGHGNDSGEGERIEASGSFRVEAFRLPVLTGSVGPAQPGTLVQPQALPVAVSLQYLNGGAAGGTPVQVSALLRPRSVEFARWPGYRFDPPRAPGAADRDNEDGTPSDGARLVANQLPVTLDAQGQGQVQLPALPPLPGPHDVVLEASFNDPNGEVQTLRSTHAVWPAAVVAGVRTEGWMSVARRMRMQALAVDTTGQPVADVPLQVQAILHTTTTTRKRLVGGFYTYDNQRSRKDLGTLCRGKSDARGLLLCEVQVLEAGEVELVVTAQDREGRSAQAAETVWVTGQGELWFGGDDHDRMDVLLDQAHYSVGDTAKLQVRMPFREATALVSVEREGILHTEVVQLHGKDPTIALPVQPGWGPNVYVSVLALRGRLYEVPWYSFFTWGYKAPRQWWRAYRGSEYVAPTAMVDLSKPAYRLGVAELKVQDRSQQLHVALQADQARYQVRQTARVTVKVQRADGQPAAGAEVAIAAVDQALLELSPNPSWQLSQALWQRRDWNVETATAQMEVVGRRHYGRKAAPPGGGGGSGAPTRELLDTLLLWLPRVQLDAQGQAVVEIPLNDALTRFTVVAVADDGVQRFGTGTTSLHTTQDVQLISGIPPVVREGDQLRAQVTVRNTTQQAMQVQLTPQVPGLTLAAQTHELPAGQAREVAWDVTVPALLAHSPQAAQMAWPWTVHAEDRRSGARDALAITPQVLPAVPVTVQQATLQQVDGRWEPSVERPDAALPGQGGIRLHMSAQLADPATGVPGLQDWWAAYPYSCLEQTMGRAMGLNDAALWQRTMDQLPTYLDDDGLALYFPAQAGQRAQGSDTLTAHVLATSHAMAALDRRFVLPPALQARMESALLAWVEGRVERKGWSPQPDLAVRKLAAIAALSLSGKARAAQLHSVQIQPAQWPSHALLDWLTITQRVADLPEATLRQQEAVQLLKNRLSYQGSQLVFSTDAQDRWWWLMQGPDVNAARLVMASLGDSAWDAERPRLVTGLLARQRQGAWSTTTANTWAGLALRQFSRQYEREAVTGHTTAMLGTTTQTVDWHTAGGAATDAVAAQGVAEVVPGTALPRGSAQLAADSPHTVLLPWGERRLGQLVVQHRGTGQPWVALQSWAAVPRTAPVNAGYQVRKTVTAVQGQAQAWRRGDIVRVQLQVQASAPMTWVALHDPLPAGATLLGSGLGRDSEAAMLAAPAVGDGNGGSDDTGAAPTFVERGQDSYRAYWSYLPQGSTTVSYTLRLNNAGDFALPPTRVEALYAPEMFGELPNARWKVAPP